MAEIRVTSSSGSDQPAAQHLLTNDTWLPDGRGYGKPRPLSSSLAPPEKLAPPGQSDGASGTASLHSQPDIDTILPLPGSGARATSSQMMNVVSPLSSDEEETTRGGGGGVERRPLLRRLSSEFMTVEHPFIGSAMFEDDITAHALEECKKTVLQPYFGFLKVVGWRTLRITNYDLEPPLWQRVINIVWPLTLLLLLLTSCITQVITCFRRDLIHNEPVLVNNATVYNVTCEHHILTSFLIPDLLLLIAFLYALYIFRWAQTEHLITLTEAVFLALITTTGKHSHRTLNTTLQMLMVVGVFWVLFSFSGSIFRIFSLHLLSPNTHIQWIPSYQHEVESSNLLERWVFVIVTLLGFILLDMAYAAVVINYAVQCQLLVYLMQATCDHIRIKDWEIERSIKEIKTIRDFVSILNSHLSRAVSLLLFIFLCSSVQAFYGLKEVSRGSDRDFALEVVAGTFSILQWTFMLALPLVQAARVTRASMSLRKVGLEMRSRPYSYKDTPQLDLDSLVMYISGLRMSAKLINMPISPAVVGVFIFVVSFVLFLVFQYDNYSWALWL